MFVHLGGDENTKPTYFEVIAADRLVPSLKAAVVYALSVFSQRHPWVHQLLHYDDEVFALVTLALDGHSLLSSDSAFADSLYGLRRRPLHPGSSSGLTRRQRWLILACQVLLPYLRAKVDKAYRRSAGPSVGVLGLALRYGAQQDAAAFDSEGQGGGPGSDLQRRMTRALTAAYPWLHAAIEGVTFAYHLSYLLGASDVHHPVLHAIEVSMARTSAKDLMDAEKTKHARRQALLVALRTAPAMAQSGLRGAASTARLALLRGVLGARWLLEDHSRTALVLAVFGFKALEWWYTTAEDTLAKGKVLPPPPPPPPPRPAPPPLGVGLPTNPSDCPVCKRRTTNPATVATSGYVFCYPCAFNFVMQHGRCPVTTLPASLDHIRKLYEAA